MGAQTKKSCKLQEKKNDSFLPMKITSYVAIVFLLKNVRMIYFLSVADNKDQ